MARKTRTERLTISIDKELKRRFDIVCRWKDFNMSQVAEELFDNWVQENAPPGLFDLEKEAQQDEPPATTNNSGGKGRGKKGQDG